MYSPEVIHLYPVEINKTEDITRGLFHPPRRDLDSLLKHGLTTGASSLNS